MRGDRWATLSPPYWAIIFLLDDVKEVLDTPRWSTDKSGRLVSATHPVLTHPGEPDQGHDYQLFSFTGITETKRRRRRHGKSEGMIHLPVVVRDAHDTITVQDFEDRIQAWKPGAERIYGCSEAKALAIIIPRLGMHTPLRRGKADVT